jgi:electron transfer flavoprotein beta subunit
MRVVICCKGVPREPTVESVCVAGGEIRFGDTELYINESDAYALEAAVSLKNAYKAETVALTVGPLRAQEVLYIALAKGIDQALRIDGDTSLPERIAGGLIHPLRELAPQLILTGVQSEDWMGGEVGVYLSRALGMALAYAVVEISDLDETHVRVKKEIGGGKKAEMRLRLPAVLCVQSGIQRLRYLSNVKRQKARDLPVKLSGKLDPEKVRQKIPGMMAYEAREVSLPSREGHAEMIEGPRPEKAGRLLEIIRKAV